MAKVKMSTEEKRWQAEHDARILADAEEIASNKARTRRALMAAKKMAAQAKKTAQAAAKTAAARRRGK